jgi:hypothetical protein
LKRKRCMALPSADKLCAEMEEQPGRAAGGSSGRSHGKGVDNLRRGGRLFWLDLIEKGEDIAEEGVGVMDCQPGVKAIERAMVGGGADEGQADVPAHEQIGGEGGFKLRIGTGAGPGADDFGANQGADGIHGWSARSITMVVGITGGDDGRWVVEMSKVDERMSGTAVEESTVNAVAQPGEDR